MVSLLLYHWSQVEELIGDMEGNDASGCEVPLVQLQGLTGQKVDRNSIAGERVHRQNVILLIWFLRERHPSVAGNDFNGCSRLAEITEPAPGERLDQGVDV